jgi:uncharacterized protein DUF3551
MEHTMRKILALAAVLSAIAMTAPVASAAGSGKFCLNGPGASKNCTYQSMADCDKVKKGQQTCAADAGTTGAGTSQSAPIGNSGGSPGSSGTMKK